VTIKSSSELLEQFILAENENTRSRVSPIRMQPRIPPALAMEEPTASEPQPQLNPKIAQKKKIPRFLLKVNSVLYARATAQQLFLLRMDIQKERMKKHDEKNMYKFQHTKEIAELRAGLSSNRDSERKAAEGKHNQTRSKGLFSKKGFLSDKTKLDPNMEEQPFKIDIVPPELSSHRNGADQDRLSAILQALKESESQFLSQGEKKEHQIHAEETKERTKPNKSEGSLNNSVNSEKYYPKRGIESITEEVASSMFLSSQGDGSRARFARRRSTGFLNNLPFTKLSVSKSGNALLYDKKDANNPAYIAEAEASDPEDKQCRICFSRDSNSAFMPCGHGCVCDTCAVEIFDKNGVCPICRKVGILVMTERRTCP
jgi:Zinc finger, C3HC4 type (RING finger)